MPSEEVRLKMLEAYERRQSEALLGVEIAVPEAVEGNIAPPPVGEGNVAPPSPVEGNNELDVEAACSVVEAVEAHAPPVDNQLALLPMVPPKQVAAVNMFCISADGESLHCLC